MDEENLKKLDWLERSMMATFDAAKGTAEGLGDAEDHLRALTLILHQVCLKLGATPESFASHHGALIARCADRRLNRLEEDYPRVAGLLDGRTLEETDTGDPIPPLFPEQ